MREIVASNKNILFDINPNHFHILSCNNCIIGVVTGLKMIILQKIIDILSIPLFASINTMPDFLLFCL